MLYRNVCPKLTTDKGLFIELKRVLLPFHFNYLLENKLQIPMMMMMSMVFNVPPTAKVIRGRAILAKGIAERKNLLTRVLVRQHSQSYFILFVKNQLYLHGKPVEEK